MYKMLYIYSNQNTFKENTMKILLTLLSWFFVLLSISSVLTALYFFYPYIDYILIGNDDYKTTTGVVGQSYSTFSKSATASPGSSMETVVSKTVEIRFADEENNIFQITIKPVFLNIEKGKEIPVKYFVSELEKEWANEEKQSDSPRPIGLSGCPIPIIYSLEKPIIFLLAALIAFILRYVPLFIKNSLPT